MIVYYPTNLPGHLVVDVDTVLYLVPMTPRTGWDSRTRYYGHRQSLRHVEGNEATIQALTAGVPQSTLTPHTHLE